MGRSTKEAAEARRNEQVINLLEEEKRTMDRWAVAELAIIQLRKYTALMRQIDEIKHARLR